jgi:acyl carrier protein
MNIRQTVVDVIAKNAKKPLPTGDEQALMGCAYLDEGIIDSLGIVMMVTELEDSLGVSFSAEDMQSYEFQTIGGLIGRIDQLLAAKA